MTYKLDLSPSCISKEIDRSREEILELERKKKIKIVEKNLLFEQILDCMDKLYFKFHCICNDVLCDYWEDSRCRCGGSINCKNVIAIPSERYYGVPSNIDSEPNAKEIEEAQKEIQTVIRKPNELYIFWKSRVAKAIYDKAFEKHNFNNPNSEATGYHYYAPRYDNSSLLLSSLQLYISSIRSEDRGFRNIVACSRCGRTFINEEKALKHRQKALAKGQTEHEDTYIVYPNKSVLMSSMPQPSTSQSETPQTVSMSDLVNLNGRINDELPEWTPSQVFYTISENENMSANTLIDNNNPRGGRIDTTIEFDEEYEEETS